MTGNKTGVAFLIAQTKQAFAELSPESDAPAFDAVWEMCVDLTNDAGARLLEHKHGSLLSAAEEVRLYLTRLERVGHVGANAPLRVPRLAARHLRTVGRYIEDTDSTEELVTFLLEVPALCEAVGEYLIRAHGRPSRPVVDVLNIAVRAGSIFTDCLSREAPTLTLEYQ